MLLRRYGAVVRSVIPHFDARAITEVGFRRDGEFSMSSEEFSQEYRREELHELTASTEGPVQDEAEQALLEELGGKLRALEEGLEADEVLVLESVPGEDYPKTRDRKVKQVVEGKNRLYFHWRVEPPLRIGRYRIRDPAAS